VSECVRVHVCVCPSVCARVCVRVCEREREREGQKERVSVYGKGGSGFITRRITRADVIYMYTYRQSTHVTHT